MKLPYLKKNGKYILMPFIDKNERRQNLINSLKMKPRFISDEEAARIKYQQLISPKPKEYDDLNFFVEGMARVKVNGRLTYIDYNEKQLKLSGNYLRLGDFNNGIAEVMRDDGYWYLINKNGIEINKNGYEGIHHDENGFYIGITPFGEDHLLDKSGNRINIDDNSDRLRSNKVKYFKTDKSLILVVYTDYTYRALDLNGIELFRTKNFNYISNFYYGYAVAITKDNKVVIIDGTLNYIKELQDVREKEIDIMGFIDGYSIIKKRNYQRLINLKGETICEYPEISYINEGFFKVGKTINGRIKYSFLNSSFEEATSFKYDQIEKFSEGVASYKVGHKCGMVDSDGQEILEPEYAYLGNCKNGFVQASYGDYRGESYFGKFGFVNRVGKKICSIIYDEVSDFDGNKIAKVKLNGFYGLMNDRGEELTKLHYDSIDENIYDCYFVTMDDKRFIIDETDFQFSEETYRRDPFTNHVYGDTELPY